MMMVTLLAGAGDYAAANAFIDDAMQQATTQSYFERRPGVAICRNCVITSVNLSDTLKPRN